MTDRFFRNLDGSGPPANFSRLFKWAVADKVTGKRRSSPDRAEIPRVAPDLELLRTPPEVGAPARLTWLGHASWLVQLDGISLLIDPALKPAISTVIKRNVPPGVEIAQLPKIDAQLVSHNHYDHLDLPTLRPVGAKVIAGAGLDGLFRSARLPFTPLEWWQTTRVGPVEVMFVPAQHWSRRGLNDVNKTLWGGFVVKGRRASVYHSGDTAYFAGFKQIGERCGPIDAAMLPIGAYDPEWFMSTQHMNPEQAAQAYVDLRARTFLAMHWGTFKLTDEPLDEPPQRLAAEWDRRALPAEQKRVLAVGETVQISAAG